MGPSRVEVSQRVFGKDVVEVPLGEDDEVIGALAAHAPEKSLAHGVHERCLNRSAHDANPNALGDTVEHRTELVVPVPDEELRPLPEGRLT